ncbi:hepatic lectin-like [Penaeus vannamei]|uniref:hepatic lectin-like n=1 Tax=Penaeus vannamei TaxID=6689 RepID=UPI00387FA73E
MGRVLAWRLAVRDPKRWKATSDISFLDMPSPSSSLAFVSLQLLPCGLRKDSARVRTREDALSSQGCLRGFACFWSLQLLSAVSDLLKSSLAATAPFPPAESFPEHPSLDHWLWESVDKTPITAWELVLSFYIYMSTSEEQGYYVYGTQYVRLLHTRLNYFDANKECKKENGKLVAVRDKNMNDLLLALLYKFAVWEALIGLNDMEKEGEWQYVDNTPASYQNWDWNGWWERYDRNCAVVTINDNGPWRHVNCWNKFYFFCEIPMFL